MQRSFCWSIFLSVLILAGCGQKLKNLPVDYVEGIVQLDGQPLAGATVTFMPKETGSGETARGITAQNGKYQLTSMNGDAAKGALAGEYIVMVWKSETREVNPPRYNKTADVYIKSEAVDIVPSFYAEPESTPFTFTVEPGKKNVFDISIDSKISSRKRGN